MEVDRAKGRGCLTRSVKLARLVRYCSSSAESVTIACRPHRCARVRGGAHGQLPGGEGAPGQGKDQRKEGRQEVRGEKGETKKVTLTTAF